MSMEKQRVVQEYVPGKQVTLAHLIAHPKEALCEKLGVGQSGAIGILTITPCEAALIAADVATKTAAVDIGFMDRFTGSVVLVGSDPGAGKDGSTLALAARLRALRVGQG